LPGANTIERLNPDAITEADVVNGEGASDNILYQQSPLQAARAQVASLTSGKTLGDLIYTFQDKYVDLKHLRKHIQEIGGAVSDLNDAYQGEEHYHGRVGKQTKDFRNDELKPLLAEMKMAGIGTEDFERFLHARHAPEANAEMLKRNPNQKEIDTALQAAKQALTTLQTQLTHAQAQGTATKAIERAIEKAQEEVDYWKHAQAFRGTEAERHALSGMSDADAAAHMAALTPDQRRRLDALAARVDAINAKTLTELERTGLMDRATLNEWRKTYQYYVPLHRDEAHPDSVAHPIGGGFNVRGGAARSRVGSNTKVTHISEDRRLKTEDRRQSARCARFVVCVQ
jgi:hypothetical protein